MYEYMSAAAVVHEPGAQIIPLVYKYDFTTATVMERKDRLRTPDKWEYIIYNNYLTLMKDFEELRKNPTPDTWRAFRQKHSKFVLPYEKPDPLPNELNDITYTWKIGRNALNNLRSERVRIHRYNSNDLSVIVMQPSWHGSNLDVWDNTDTLYVVDDPKLSLTETQLTLLVIASVMSFWGDNSAFNTFIKNDKEKKAAQDKKSAEETAKYKAMFTKSINPSQPGGSRRNRRRKSRRTRRTRRTRRK